MEMVTKKCEEMKREMLVEVETIREQTRGELEGAAVQMGTLQEAMTKRVRQRNTRHGGKNDANDEREKRKKPDTDVELEDDPS